VTIDALVPYMPHLQSILNASAAILLTIGYYYVKKNNRIAHRNCMIGALTVSTIFLISYLTYHAKVGYQPFEGQGFIRPIYFTLLFSHIALSGIIVPMVLATVYFVLRGDFKKHPLIARWTLPTWLYISISGVIVYFLAFHVYPPQQFVWETLPSFNQ